MCEGRKRILEKIVYWKIHNLCSTKNYRDDEMTAGEICKECGMDRAYKLWPQCRKRENI